MEAREKLFTFAVLVVGAYTAVGGWSDAAFFWENSRALRVVGFVGQPAARVFYVVLGCALVGFGVLRLVAARLVRWRGSAPS